MSSTSPPRAIRGTVGSRIRLILGETGSEWLLLLNNDDGDRIWQSQDWKSIPKKVAKQLENCIGKGRIVKQVDFGPTGAWFIRGENKNGKTGGHSWWGDTIYNSSIRLWSKKATAEHLQVCFGTDASGQESNILLQGSNGTWPHNVDADIEERVRRLHECSKGINFIRLFHDHGYFISDGEGIEWKGVGAHCSEELEKGEKVEEIAVAEDGSWVVIHPNDFTCSNGVDSGLRNALKSFFLGTAPTK